MKPALMVKQMTNTPAIYDRAVQRAKEYGASERWLARLDAETAGMNRERLLRWLEKYFWVC